MMTALAPGVFTLLMLTRIYPTIPIVASGLAVHRSET
jgi:hypothetical protein